MKNSQRADFAVLLMAHGGPDSIDDIPGFLAHIRHGRPVSQEFLEEVTDRYRLIGGNSPLRGICERLAQSLRKVLKSPVYLGMRHWHPFIQDTVQKIALDGHTKILAICLAPHYSSLSILAYQKVLIAANDSLKFPLELQFVRSWPLQRDFIAFHAQEILAARRELGTPDWSDICVMLTAHSLPSRILQSGDPYVEELQQTVDAVSRKLQLDPLSCKLVFQSASPSSEPWLSPIVEEELEHFAASGRKNVIISPIGFIAEHVEILYDIDIAAKKRADSLGIKIKRTSMLNDRQEMVAILQGIVEESASKFRKSVVLEPGSVASHDAA